MLKKLALLLCVLLALPLLASAEAATVDSAEALQAYLAQCREEGLTTFSLTCTTELLSTLKADNYAALKRLCTLAGIEDFEMKTTRSGKLTLGSVVYGSPWVAECNAAEDAKSVVADLMAQGADKMTLLCSAEAFQALFREGGMYRVLTELGIDDVKMQGNTQNYIYLSELKPMSVPYAQVASVSEAGEKVAAWREEKAPAFNLIFDMDAFAALTREDYQLIAFLGGVENYQLSYNTYTGMLLFTEVAYTDVPGAYCQSEEEVVAAIRAMGARGFTSFQLKLDQTTYDALYANRFARLYELQAQAGMTGGDLRYSSVSRLLLFDNAVIHADVTIFSTLAEVTAYTEACAWRGDEDISMLMTDEVYDALMAGVDALFVSDAKFYDLIANAGIAGADDISFNRHSGAVSLQGVHYYAGTNILRALEGGDLSALTAREQQALEAAKAMAADCTRATPVDTARAIHDALCALITYTDDESTDEDDCCIGALLSGQANCDGYADALVLVGRLAGLNVRYQHGDSLNGGMGSYFSTHMWNLIELDGTWRMIDVTWDDMDGAPVYLWFNIGEDRAARSHVWSAEMTVPMQAVTESANRPVAEYFAATEAEITAAAASAQAAGHTVFDIYVAADSGLRMIAIREAAVKGLYGSIGYMWIDSLNCLHVQLVP